MPEHKGIQVTVVSQWELQHHQEFPHPDSSQFTNRSPNVGGNLTIPDLKSPSTSPDSKADRLLGRQSSVSVYIPSVPGARFWLRYNIVDPSFANVPWFYFKFYMNGGHITSWGTNVEKKPSGQVMRALFDPSERWNYKQEGLLYKNNGTEARPFFFSNDEEISAAEDGGLLEVRVFRARGRQRKLPRPEEWRSQEQYGIKMPSGGLLDRPQEAKYYDWHLRDDKNTPFVSFKFHYRSWDHLTSLQLIPEDHPRHLLLSSSSILSLNCLPELEEELINNYPLTGANEESQKPTPRQSPEPIRDSTSSTNSNTPWITSVFDRTPERVAEQNYKGSEDTFLRKPALNVQCRVPTTRFWGSPDSQVSSVIEQIGGDNFTRPLPEVPQNRSRSMHSRQASTASGAISITPSLIPYMERDTVSPPPITGVASVVPIGRPTTQQVHEADERDEIEEDSRELQHKLGVDDSFDMKPLPLSISKREGVDSPPPSGLGLFTLPNVTIRKKKGPLLKPLPKFITSPDINHYGENPVNVDADENDQESTWNTTTLSFSESEWMCKTPSPVRDDPEHARVQNLWSPRFGKQRDSMKPGGSLRKKAKDWYESIRNSAEHDDSPSNTGSRGVKIKGGNWI